MFMEFLYKSQTATWQVHFQARQQRRRQWPARAPPLAAAQLTLLVPEMEDIGSDYSDSSGDEEQHQLDEALFSACVMGDLPGARAAVRAGAGYDRDTSVTELIGHRALHVAADAGQLELVRFLLAEGAACDPQNEEGHTPLHLASVSH